MEALANKFHLLLEVLNMDTVVERLTEILERQKDSIITDLEMDHIDADKALCDFICELGYPTVVELFRKIRKWYA